LACVKLRIIWQKKRDLLWNLKGGNPETDGRHRRVGRRGKMVREEKNKKRSNGRPRRIRSKPNREKSFCNLIRTALYGCGKEELKRGEKHVGIPSCGRQPSGGGRGIE